MGVWIETSVSTLTIASVSVTPCMGVWIETQSCYLSYPQSCVTPCMGVWIETSKKVTEAGPL